MSMRPLYGYPCVSDPNYFSPDAECCSPAEIEAHRVACANFGKPAYVPNKGCETLYDGEGRWVGHITRTSWGIGVNLIMHCDDCGEPNDDVVHCHDCGRDFCPECWPVHANSQED